ncbi:MAG: hypothetical protein K8823_1563 [Cenarchaeum symbiont of Oopsacas minuta]|nr:hypothetical protein [Cenarchaeum symbiont of Oopsacas minuta]
MTKKVKIPLTNRPHDPKLLEEMEARGSEKWKGAKKALKALESVNIKNPKTGKKIKLRGKIMYALGERARRNAGHNWNRQNRSKVSDYVLENWVPQQELVPATRQGSALSAAATKSKIAPRYFHNPHQGFEYIIFSDMYQFTELGAVVQELVGYLVGERFSPKIRLKKKLGKDDSELKLIEEYQYIVDQLNEVDEALGSTDEGGIDLPFQEKMLMVILNTFVFNRCAGIYTYKNEGLEINDKNGKRIKVKGLPTGFIPQHPQDIGVIEVEPNTWKLKSAQFQYVINENSGFLPSSNIFYLWNAILSAPIHGSMWYGTSLGAFALEEARTLRQLTARNFPAYGNIFSTGNPLIQIDPQGADEKDRELISQNILADFSGDGPTLLWYPDGLLTVHNLEHKIPIQEMIEFRKSIREAIIIKARLPLSLFGSEKDTNRATLEMRVQLARRTLKPQREWLGRVIADQHYMRNFKAIYPDPNCKERRDVEIVTHFDDLQIDTAEDRMDRLAALISNGFPLSIAGAAEVMEQPDLEKHIDMVMYKAMRDKKLQDLAEPAPDKEVKQNTLDLKDKETVDRKKVRVK